MGRTVRYILCLLIFSLLVSAGGIAASQTLSRFVSYDDLAPNTPLKSSHTEQIEAGYAVADHHQLGPVQQVTSPLSCQACRQRQRIARVRAASLHLPVIVSFIQRYPQSLSPPPRPATYFL
jgi:hypothetical protein